MKVVGRFNDSKWGDKRPRNNERSNQIGRHLRDNAFRARARGVFEKADFHLPGHDEDGIEIRVGFDDGLEVGFKILDVFDVDLDCFETR